MSFFESIKNAIFGSAKAEEAPAAAPNTAAAPSAAPTAPPSSPSAASTSHASASPASTASASTGNVDVAAILDQAVKSKGQKLNWRTSIVDLMKALDIESSIGARKELAQELGYTGDANDSATMNVGLHKQVIRKLSENGGKVPADLLD